VSTREKPCVVVTSLLSCRPTGKPYRTQHGAGKPLNPPKADRVNRRVPIPSHNCALSSLAMRRPRSVFLFFCSGHLFREHPLVNALDDLPDFHP
jgi:hypothetical protein